MKASTFLGPTVQQVVAIEEITMRFPNLVWALDEKKVRHYELAAKIGMDASRFSRCLRGRFEFAPQERQRIVELLGYSASWLFENPKPLRESRCCR